MSNRAVDVLSEFIFNTHYQDVPDQVIERASDCILDVIGSAVAGHTQNGTLAMQSVMQKHNQGDLCSIWFSNKTSNVISAATVNAMAATSLDIDDGHRMAAGHPGVAIISSAFATAEETNATISEILCAIVLGYEVAISVALSRHSKYNDSTVSGRWSGIGACVARSKLLGLTNSQIGNAILIAEQHAPRVSSAMHHGFAGSDVKEGIAWSVLSGMYACDLSVNGFKGYPDTFEQNILYDPQTIKANIYNFQAIDGLFFKPYACCRWIHSAIDGLLTLMCKHQIKAKNIRAVEVSTFDRAVNLGNHLVPTNEVEAQFSIPFCLAAVTLKGVQALTPLDKKLIGDPSITKFTKKVKIKKNLKMEEMFPAKAPAIVKVEHLDGVNEIIIDAAFGDPTNPMTRADLQDKFAVFSKGILSEKKVSSIIRIMNNFSRLRNKTPTNLFNSIRSLK